MKKRWEFDLIITALLVIDGAASILAGIDAPQIRVLVAFVLLLAPGYALRSVLFPKRFLDSAEQLLISLGSSVIVVILTGVGIYLAGWIMDASTWASALTLFTLVACGVALLRRRAPAAEMLDLSPLRFKWGQALLLLVAVSLVFGAVNLADTPISNPANLQGYTILWILPVLKGAPQFVHLGVISNQFIPTNYRLQIVVGNRVIHEWPDIQLAPGESWESIYAIPGTPGANTQVQAYLYKLDAPRSVYRQVNLQVAQ
jgi:uncharacterized membrane protein